MLSNRGLEIDQLYRLYYRQMCLYAAHFLGGSGDVEDVVQDAFAALWDRISNGDMPSKPEAYLAASVRNVCIDRLPEGRRRMLLMHLRDGLKCPEIAKRLGVSEGTVRNQIYRALKALRRNNYFFFSKQCYTFAFLRHYSRNAKMYEDIIQRKA